MTPNTNDDHITRGEFREFAQETRSDLREVKEIMRDMSSKMERTITKVEVSDTKREAIQKEIDDHKAEHAEHRKWAWGVGGAGLLAFIKATVDWFSGQPPRH